MSLRAVPRVHRPTERDRCRPRHNVGARPATLTGCRRWWLRTRTTVAVALDVIDAHQYVTQQLGEAIQQAYVATTV